MLEGLQARVCEHQDILQKLIDNVSLLDMLQARTTTPALQPSAKHRDVAFVRFEPSH